MSLRYFWPGPSVVSGDACGRPGRGRTRPQAARGAASPLCRCPLPNTPLVNGAARLPVDSTLCPRGCSRPLESVLEHLPEAIFVTDRDGILRFVNGEWERAFGDEGRPTAGRHVSEMLDADRVEGVLASNARVFATGEPFRYEVALSTRDGLRRFDVHKILYRDPASGEPLLLGVANDITSRVEAEAQRRTLDARMLESQKLESLGRLAGGVAHEFNNLLVGVMGHAELALAELPADSGAAAHLRRAVHAAARAAELSGQMLAYAGRGPVVRQRVSLNTIVEGTRELLSAAVPRRTRLEIHLDPALPDIDGDPGPLRQLVLNLVTNAGEAVDGHDGRIVIRTGLRLMGEAQRQRLVAGTDCAEGNYAFVEVEDSGAGMDDDVRDRVFEPFYSTKFAGRGLGLAVVRGVTQSHGGAIALDSAVGRGTLVRVLLPVAIAPSAPARTASATGRCVLVVDDEPGVRQVASAALRAHGFDVVAAEDGMAAITIWQQRRDNIVLVLADLTMPHMDGRQLAETLRARGSRAPVLFMSGYDTSDQPSDVFALACGFLPKPFHVADLVATVRDAVALPTTSE